VVHVFACFVCFVCFYCCCCGVGDGWFIWNPQAAIKQFLQAVFASVHTHHAFICLKTYTFLCVLPEFPHKTIENGTFIDNKRKFSVENPSVPDSELLKTEVYRLGVDGQNATPDNWLTSQSLQSPVVYRECH